jgi:hypothetical protein
MRGDVIRSERDTSRERIEKLLLIDFLPNFVANYPRLEAPIWNNIRTTQPTVAVAGVFINPVVIAIYYQYRYGWIDDAE